MSVWFRGAIFERTCYVGEEVGAAVEESFCALRDEKRSGGGVFENRWEGCLCLWIGTGRV